MSRTILDTIYRFPVKGFPGQRLPATKLIAGAGIANDRRFAITNGTEDTGGWMRARSFFINAVIDGMSKFKMTFDGENICLRNIDGMELAFQLDDAASLDAANKQVAGFMGPVGVQADQPAPRIIERENENANWDYVDTPISIINAESVKAVGTALGKSLDPLRFRGNLVVSGLPAWEEFSWMGKRIQIGHAVVDVHRPIDRCPTPGVNPETGERDVEVTPGIQEHFGHIYCGMYAKVVKGGEIREGDTAKIIADAEIRLEDTFVTNASHYALWPRTAEVATCEASGSSTRLSLKATSPWPLPEAKPGQRIRLHLNSLPDAPGWTQEYIAAVSPEYYHFEVETSQTADPVTEFLRRNLTAGDRFVISGPFGRV